MAGLAGLAPEVKVQGVFEILEMIKCQPPPAQIIND